MLGELLELRPRRQGGVAGRGALEEMLAGAPWWICWPRCQGGAAGRGYRGEEDAAPWQEWQHREETAGDGAVHKKTCRGIGVRNLGRCAMIILLLKTH